MHRQLHHDSSAKIAKGKSTPQTSSLKRTLSRTKLSRTSSALSVFEKLRTRISRRILPHPEDSPADLGTGINDLSLIPSECTSKGLKDPSVSNISGAAGSSTFARTESYGCHLCSFVADRITILDRHLLNDHKIGIDNLLKLVLAKTKDGLKDDEQGALSTYPQSYYRPLDDIIEHGEFIFETVTPKIKILRHASTNTDLKLGDLPKLKDYTLLSKEIEQMMMRGPMERRDKEDFLVKMKTLNDCMCRYASSTNTLKKVLTKEFDAKHSVRTDSSMEEVGFDLSLGEFDRQIEYRMRVNFDQNHISYYNGLFPGSQSPRNWDKSLSDRLTSARSRHAYSGRSEKMKRSCKSFFF